MAVHYNNLPTDLLSHGMPIYAGTDRGNPEMIGSSVLGKLNGIFFLITAAHVVDTYINCHPSILAPDQGRFLRIAKLKSKFSCSNDIDLFVAELEGEHLEETLKWRKFIDLNPLIQNPFHYDIAAGSSIGFVGYPSSKNSLRDPPPPGIQTIPQFNGYLITCKHAAPYSLGYFGRDPRNFIVADFSRRKYQTVAGARVQAPDPHGLSGGGVWLLCGDDDTEMTVSHYHLVGIGIESVKNRASNRSSLVATRLEHVFSALKWHWPNAVLA
jgi:hypothetical protein